MYDEDKKLLSFKKWRIFNCHRHFGYVSLILFYGKYNFINRFLVLNGLWIPKEHYINLVKLFIYWFINDIVVKEINKDVKTWGKKERIFYTFNNKPLIITLVLMCVEIGITFKFNINNDYITNGIMPNWVFAFWCSVYAS